MLGVIITLLAVVAIAYFVIKNYYPPMMLWLLGVVLLVIGVMMGNAPVGPKTATNFVGFDIAQALTDLLKSRLGGLGLNIMAIAGFSYEPRFSSGSHIPDRKYFPGNSDLSSTCQPLAHPP